MKQSYQEFYAECQARCDSLLEYALNMLGHRPPFEVPKWTLESPWAFHDAIDRICDTYDGLRRNRRYAVRLSVLPIYQNGIQVQGR